MAKGYFGFLLALVPDAMTFQRFEVVPPPVEERLFDVLSKQAIVVINTANSKFETFKKIDEQTVRRATRSSVSLLMPGSVPFVLFVLAVWLRILHSVLLRLRARRMVTRSGVCDKLKES